jgi:hypothetical protein
MYMIGFIRLVHDWEVDVLASFYTLLYPHNMRRDREDVSWWVPSRKGKFDGSFFYKTLTCNENLIPLKEYLADKGSFESGFFRLDGGAREGPYIGQS